MLKSGRKGLIKMLKNLMLALLVFCLAAPAQSALLNEDKTQIVVSGQATVKAAADVSYVMLGVERLEQTASEAQDIVARKMNNILASLKKIGIPKDKIETTRVSLRPHYEYKNRQNVLAGYIARNQIRVSVEKLDDLGRTVDAAVTAGASNIDNISFGIKDESVYKKAALQKAFADAKDKAVIIAAAAGLKLEKLVSVQESGARVILPQVDYRSMAKGSALESSQAPTPIIPGDIQVRGSLSVVYACSKL